MIVLDTSILIDALRGHAPAAKLVRELFEKGEGAYSAITEAEVLSGRSCDDSRAREDAIHLLSVFEKIPVDNPLVQKAGDLRRTYGIEVPDAIIAATALALKAKLLTRNVRDFERVKELSVQSPY